MNRLQFFFNRYTGELETVSFPTAPQLFADRLPRSLFLQILGQGAMASPMVALKGPLMSKRDYSLTFALKHALKDMRFALGLGAKVRGRYTVFQA